MNKRKKYENMKMISVSAVIKFFNVGVTIKHRWKSDIHFRSYITLKELLYSIRWLGNVFHRPPRGYISILLSYYLLFPYFTFENNGATKER